MNIGVVDTKRLLKKYLIVIFCVYILSAIAGLSVVYLDFYQDFDRSNFSLKWVDYLVNVVVFFIALGDRKRLEIKGWYSLIFILIVFDCTIGVLFLLLYHILQVLFSKNLEE